MLADFGSDSSLFHQRFEFDLPYDSKRMQNVHTRFCTLLSETSILRIAGPFLCRDLSLENAFVRFATCVARVWLWERGNPLTS